MKILNFIKAFFNNWIYPIIFFGATLFIMVISSFDNGHYHYFQNTAGIALILGILILIISSISLLYKRMWVKGILSIGALISGTIVASIIFFILSTTINMIDGDHWADDLYIPQNIQIENPVNGSSYYRSDSILNLNKSKTDLVLYNSSQPGIYQYDFWTGRIEKGNIYLKIFEITTNEQLSSEEVKLKTPVFIENKSDTITRFSLTKDFTIYEGDWGKYYAARVEVWFISATDEEESKLFQKNFKIQGWMH